MKVWSPSEFLFNLTPQKSSQSTLNNTFHLSGSNVVKEIWSCTRYTPFFKYKFSFSRVKTQKKLKIIQNCFNLGAYVSYWWNFKKHSGEKFWYVWYFSSRNCLDQNLSWNVDFMVLFEKQLMSCLRIFLKVETWITSLWRCINHRLKDNIQGIWYRVFCSFRCSRLI